MMTVQDFRHEVVRISLKGVDKQPADWVTFNDALHTKILEGETCSNTKISLIGNELPILECSMENSYLLITTERLISILDGLYNESLIANIERFLNDNMIENFAKDQEGRYPKINTLTIRETGGSKLSFAIDSYYPASFVQILVYNILSYKTLGKWFLSPK